MLLKLYCNERPESTAAVSGSDLTAEGAVAIHRRYDVQGFPSGPAPRPR